MTTINPFVREMKDYTRDLSFLRHYVEDCSKFLQIMTGDSPEKCTAFVKTSMKPGGIFELKDPEVIYLQRENMEDRIEKKGTFLQYMSESINSNELIAPTFTTYLPVTVKQSMLVEFVDDNVKKRSRAKKEMFTAKMAGMVDLELFKNAEQSNAKIANNAISGGHVSTSTPLHNKTAHSTLTSNCRNTSGFGNANNEKMLSGNRHYHHPSIVINNIVSITNRTDLKKVEETIAEYGMHYPTPQEAMDVVLYSTHLYWRSTKNEEIIRELLTKLTPIERAAFVYIGDLHHIAKFNDSLAREFIGELSAPILGNSDEPLKIIHGLREEYVSLATQLLPTYMKGFDWKKLKESDPVEKEKLQHVAATMQNINNTILMYRSFIETFFVSDNVPASLAFFPTSVRRSALTSDTDSTIFTVQDWVKWKTGSLVVDDVSNGVAATMIFLAAEAITHILAKMSANFGIETKRIHQIAMKNEFKFDVFVPTSVGKHYFAYIGCQEGNLYMDYDMEIKGVHLKSSNVPAEVMKKAEAMMKEIMDTAAKGKTISIAQKLNEVGEIERGILTSALKGESTYYRSQQIRSADSYVKSEEQSPYSHYLFWQRIFAKKYGEVPPPPYAVYKVPVDLPNMKAITAWLDKIQDTFIREELRAFFKETGKKTISTLMLPQQIMVSQGLPEEVAMILDTRRMIMDNVGVFYLILETLGYAVMDDKINQLVSDYH